MEPKQKRKMNDIMSELHPVYRSAVKDFAELCCGLQKLKLQELARLDKKDWLYKPTFAIDCFRGAFDVDPDELRKLQRISDQRSDQSSAVARSITILDIGN